MADKKISQLTGATTPLDGTEVLPIVQSGSTVKVANNDLRPKQIQSNATSGVLQVVGPASAATRVMTVPDANFTVARTDAANLFTGDQTLSTGNIIQGTAAKGVNFTANTPAAGMTSQLLNWYEEGTWTVTLYDASTGGNASPTTVTGYYTRMGRQVTASFSSLNSIDTTGMTAGGTLYISLPITASSIGAAVGSVITRNVSFTSYDYIVPYVTNSANRALIRKVVTGGSDATVLISDLTSTTARLFYFTLTYFV